MIELNAINELNESRGEEYRRRRRRLRVAMRERDFFEFELLRFVVEEMCLVV